MKRGGIGVAEGVAVEDDCRGEAAGADAARGGQRCVGVGSGFAGLNAEGLFGGGEKRGCAFDVAGGTHADEAAVPARRFKSKEVIEGGDSVGLAERDAKRFCDEAERGLVEIAEGLLNGVKSFDECVARKTMPPHGAIDDAPAFVVGRERGFFQGKGHGRLPEAEINKA